MSGMYPGTDPEMEVAIYSLGIYRPETMEARGGSAVKATLYSEMREMASDLCNSGIVHSDE